MKLTKRDILVLLYIVSVVGLFLVYKFVVTPSMEEIDEVNNVNAGLQNQVTALEAKLGHQEELEKEISAMDKEIVNLASAYPKTISEEDIVLYVNEVNKELQMNVTSVSFSTPSVVYTVLGNGAAARYSMALNQISVNVDYTTDYEGFKRIVNYINEDKEHREIASVGVSADILVEEEATAADGETTEEIKDPLNGNKDDEGEQVISGSFSLLLYYLEGKVSDGEETPRYEKQDVTHGNVNIFDSAR